MSIETLLKSLPETAKDIRLNFTSLLQDQASGLDTAHIHAIFYASLISVVPSQMTRDLIEAFEQGLDEATVHGAKIASAIMSMNNIYYRFVHLAENSDFPKMNAGLRMQTMRQHGIDDVLFELMSLAISALNGCGFCIKAHIQGLKKQSVSDASVQLCARIASVVNAQNQVSMH